jgi:hypothetical protein
VWQKVHPAVAIGRDLHPLAAARALHRRQAAGGDLGVEEDEIAVATLMEAKHLACVFGMRRQ